jgi:uncharacterized membrane protein (UPF0136 family)
MVDKVVILGYGLFLVLGGYFGWKAGSSQSLIMSLVSAALVFLGFFLSTSNPRTGYILLSVVGGALTVVFIMRVMATHKFMPAGMLLIITAAFLVFCMLRLPKT